MKRKGRLGKDVRFHMKLENKFARCIVLEDERNNKTTKKAEIMEGDI